jgi:N5-(cytidine 5'-diphosphoramidyl)-L-glutamine hydrolase
MKTVAVTQRVAIVPEYAERRDCLDQGWPRFLAACGLLPLPLPNVIEVALALCANARVCGLVLSGGNDLVGLGGEAPERDSVEHALLDLAERDRLPVIGVCRGMQLIQQRCGIALRPVDGHVTPRQVIRVGGERKEVNSYHRFAAFESRPPLTTLAIADDGAIKAVRHATLPITGIMWHPERAARPHPDDVALFRRVFQVLPDGERGGSSCQPPRG